MHETKGGAPDRETAKRVRQKTYFGQDLVARPRRLALMNVFLHGLEPKIVLGDTIYEAPSSDRFDVGLTNPPLGLRAGWRPGGRAAVVFPDNCLFADQAGEVFKILAEDCNLHTVLRLPNGTFTPYSPGTKPNRTFFTKGFP